MNEIEQHLNFNKIYKTKQFKIADRIGKTIFFRLAKYMNRRK